ncbi:MAG: hypothetical protein WA364_24635 [Candidatus Nitrosopolaris sp.]
MPESPQRVANNVAKRQHAAIHQAISTTCLNEQECYDALWSYPTWQYEIDFVPENIILVYLLFSTTRLDKSTCRRREI